MDRRQFLSSCCAVSAELALLGISGSLLTGCASAKVFEAVPDHGILRIPAAQFVPNSDMLIVRTSAFDYDILLVRQPTGEVHSLLMQCTHRNNPLTASSTSLHCPAHGSSFDLNGNVIQGPATKPLKSFVTEIADQVILIHLT